MEKTIAKTLTNEIDEGKNSVTFKIFEGYIMELYKTFVVHIHVDTVGPKILVVWIVQYKKLNPNVPDLNTLLDFYEKVMKNLDAHHLLN